MAENPLKKNNAARSAPASTYNPVQGAPAGFVGAGGFYDDRANEAKPSDATGEAVRPQGIPFKKLKGGGGK